MKKAVLILGFVFISFNTYAQVDGLWEVTSVKVGDEIMTPVGKWSDLSQSRLFTSGNGWLQNSSGYWDYDRSTSELTLTATTGFEDSFGPFKVQMVGEDEMIWTREENGELVTVVNKKVKRVPKTPRDIATGLWDLEEANRAGKDILNEFDPQNNRRVFLRWDNLVFDFINGQRVAGMWRIDAHRPALDILYYDTSKEPDYWQISFEGEDSMTWTKQDLTLKFSRLTSFPE